MRQCWAKDPVERPNIQETVNVLDKVSFSADPSQSLPNVGCRMSHNPGQTKTYWSEYKMIHGPPQPLVNQDKQHM